MDPRIEAIRQQALDQQAHTKKGSSSFYKSKDAIVTERNLIPRKAILVTIIFIAFLIVVPATALWGAKFFNTDKEAPSTQPIKGDLVYLDGQAPQKAQGVLGLGSFSVSIPAQFQDSVTFQGGIVIADGKITTPDGEIKPATSSGVLSLQGQSGAVSLLAGSGISLTGLTIANSDKGSDQSIYKNIKVGSTTMSASSNNDTLTFAAGDNITLSTDTSSKKITINASQPTITASGFTDDGTIVRLTTSTDSVGIGTTAPSGQFDVGGGSFVVLSGGNVGIANTSPTQKLDITGSIKVSGSLILGSDTITSVQGDGLTLSAGTLKVGLLSSADAVGATSSTSGLEFAGTSSNQLALIQGCSNGQVLKWTSSNSTWACANDVGGSSGGIIIVQENDVTVSSTADTLDFNGSDFDLTESPAGEINIVINSGITRKANNETVSGSWTFSSATPLTLSSTSPALAIGNTGTLTITDGTNTLLTIADGGTTGNVTVSGNTTIQGTTGITATGAGAGLTFSGSGNHDITATSGTLRFGAVTLTGAIAGGSQNITGLGTINGLAITANTGVITSGTWNGTAIAATYGGTGIDTSSSTGVPIISSGTWSVSSALSPTFGGTGLTSYTTGDLLYSSASNTLAKLGIGSSSQILTVSGGIPAWADVNSLANSYWDRNNGAIYPKIASVHDLLLGSSATTSAKFGFINVNSGTPTATISAGAAGGLYLDATGKIASTARQSLTLGDATTTGNIILNQAGNVGIGTTSPQATLDVRGTLYLNDGVGANPALTFNADTNTGIVRNGAEDIRIIANGQPGIGVDGTSGTGRFYVGSGSPVSKIQIFDDGNDTASGITLGSTGGTYVQLYKSASNELTLTSTASITGNLTFSGARSISSKAMTTLTLGGSTTGNIVIDSGSSSITFSDPITAPTSSNTINNLVISSSGVITSGTWNGTAIGTQYGGTGQNWSAVATGSLPYFSGSGTMNTLAIGSESQVLTVSSGIPSWSDVGAAGINFWDRSNGVVSPKIAGVHDLLLGSSATTSAKFGFINVNSGTPTATISAGTAGALYLDATGKLATTTRQTLTIGDSTSTGDIIINPAGNVGIGSTNTSSKLYVSSTSSNGAAAIAGMHTGTGTTNYGGSFGATGAGVTNIGGYFQASGATNNYGLIVVSGNVGIGAASPTELLQVAGNSTNSGNLTFSGTRTIASRQMNTLTIGDSATGNIVFAPAGTLNLSTGLVLSSTSGQGISGAGLTDCDTAGTSKLLWDAATNQFSCGTDSGSGSGASKWTTSGSVIYPNNISDQVGIGTTTAGSVISSFFVTHNLASGALGKAVAIFNQTESQDILAASSSGTTKFSVSNSGNIGFAGGTSFVNTLASAATAARTYTFPDATGTVCLTTGNCVGGGVGMGGSGSTNYISKFTASTTLGDSSLYDNGNIGLGTTTPVEKLDINGNATVSGNLTLDAAGSFQTSRMRTLTLGGSTTGNIVIDSGSSSITISDTTDLSNNLLLNIGNAGTDFTSGGGLTLAGALVANGNTTLGDASGDSVTINAATLSLANASTLDLANTQTSALNIEGGLLNLDTSNSRVGVGTTTPLEKLDVNGNATVSGNLVLNAAGTIQTTRNQTLTIGGSATGNITLSPIAGSGTVTSTGTVNLSSGKTYQINGTDVLSATTLGSGVTASSLTSVGTISSGTWNGTAIGAQYGGTGINTSASTGVPTISSGTWSVSSALSSTLGGTGFSTYTTGDIIYASGTNTLAKRSIGSNGDVLTVSGGVPTWSSTAATNYWDRANGVVSPQIASVHDLLLGSSATASAKFGFINVNSGTPTATISAGTTGGVYIDSNGKLATTARQSLTLGDSTSTGNVILNPNGNIGIGSATPIGKLFVQGDPGGKSLANFDYTGTGFNILTASASGTTVFTLDRSGNMAIEGTLSDLSSSTLTIDDDLTLSAGSDLIMSNNTYIGTSGSAPRFVILNTEVGIQTGNFNANDNLLINIGNSGTDFTSGGGLTLAGTFTANGIASIGDGGDAITLNGSSTTLTGFASCTALETNSSGVLACGVDDGGAGSGSSGQWNVASGAYYPIFPTADILIGSSATTSAKFAFMNIGAGTPTASFSGNLTLNGSSYSLGTTARTTLNLGNTETGNINLSPGNTTALTAYTSGNVGIGTTTNPTNLLQILASSGQDKGIEIKNSGTGASDNPVLKFSNSGSNYTTIFQTTSNDSRGEIAGFYTSATNGFHVLRSDGTQALSLRGASGNVGINNANPGALLHIGSTAMTADSQILMTTRGNAGIDINADSDTTNADAGYFRVSHNNTGVQAILATVGTAGTLPVGGTVTSVLADYIALGSRGSGSLGLQLFTGTTSPTVKVTLDNNGNFGIGTTAPLNKLDVNGSVAFGTYAGTAAPSNGLIVSGNVGIGNTSGTEKLDVTGNIKVSGTTTFNGLTYTWPSSGQVSGYALTTNGSGTLSWTDPVTIGSNWQISSGALATKNTTLDLLLGGTTTASAKFAFMNVNSGSPTASIGGNLALAVPTGNAGATTLDLFNNSTFNVRQSAGGDAGATSRLYLASNGNVGIGSTSPAEKLAVAGNIFIGPQTDSTSAFSKVSQTTAGTIASGGTASIQSVSASAVYNGSLYIGTTKTDGAEVYRYDGGTSWTKVSQSTAGTIASGGTASIDGISSMTVWNGYLYVGTNESGSAEIYRYDGSTTWTKVSQSTAGTIAASGTASIDAVSAMAVQDGIFYVGTSKTNGANVYRYEGGTTWVAINGTAGSLGAIVTGSQDKINSMVSYKGHLFVATSETSAAGAGQVARYDFGDASNNKWTQVINAGGQVTSASTTGVDGMQALAVHNGSLFLGTSEGSSVEIFRYNDTIADNASDNTRWELLVSAAGTIVSGGTSNINSIMSMTSYNGSLYIGTAKGTIGISGSSEIYRWDGSGANWTKISDTTAGTVASGGTSSINQILTLTPYNGSLYAGTLKNSNAGEIYTYSAVEGMSYALKFNAASDNANAEQNGLLNTGTINFLAETQNTNNNGGGDTGSFLFSHGITTTYGAYDIAEDYPTRDSSVTFGDIMMVDPNESGYAKKATGAYNSRVIGIFSEKPGFRLSQKDALINGGRGIPIALAGRVPVKIASGSASFIAGDFLTTSNEPGRAMKATQKGYVIGKALEAWNPSMGKDTVEIFVNQTFYSPLYIANSGSMTLQPELDENGSPSARFSVWDEYNSPIVETGSYKDVVAGNIKTGHIESENIFTKAINAVSGAFGTITADRFTTDVFSVGHELQAGDITTSNLRLGNMTLSYADDTLRFLASSSAVLDITNTGDASFAGTLAARSINTKNAAVENLTVKNLLVENILTPNATTSSVLDFGNKKLTANFAEFDLTTVKTDLTVLGTSTLKDASVQENITVGGDMTIGATKIETTKSALEIQPLRQAAVSIQGGLLVIETDGTMKLNGNAFFAKDVNVSGVLSASAIKGLDDNLTVSGSATFETIAIANKTIESESDTTVEAKGTAGLVTLKQGQTHIKIKSKLVKDGSLIFITPKGSTLGKTLFIEDQVKGQYFTVGLEEPVAKDIDFNFLIVN